MDRTYSAGDSQAIGVAGGHLNQKCRSMLASHPDPSVMEVLQSPLRSVLGIEGDFKVRALPFCCGVLRLHGLCPAALLLAIRARWSCFEWPEGIRAGLGLKLPSTRFFPGAIDQGRISSLHPGCLCAGDDYEETHFFSTCGWPRPIVHRQPKQMKY